MSSTCASCTNLVRWWDAYLSACLSLSLCLVGWLFALSVLCCAESFISRPGYFTRLVDPCYSGGHGPWLQVFSSALPCIFIRNLFHPRDYFHGGSEVDEYEARHADSGVGCSRVVGSGSHPHRFGPPRVRSAGKSTQRFSSAGEWSPWSGTGLLQPARLESLSEPFQASIAHSNGGEALGGDGMGFVGMIGVLSLLTSSQETGASVMVQMLVVFWPACRCFASFLATPQSATHSGRCHSPSMQVTQQSSRREREIERGVCKNAKKETTPSVFVGKPSSTLHGRATPCWVWTSNPPTVWSGPRRGRRQAQTTRSTMRSRRM